MTMDVLATTTIGKVRGFEHGGVVRFEGVPYAAPPVGALRFRPAQPHPGWSDVRDCTVAGPICPQGPSPITAFLGGPPQRSDEDCLFVNVITPALDDARRPVMVWIHGGGFVMGAGTEALYDGASFVRRGGVVFVSLNYRLGELGWLDLTTLDEAEAGSGNAGLSDQIEALRWVRDNIAVFGGDPDNVTIFGESAGAMSVGTLLASPAARGLFHRAIAQSGAASMVLPPDAAAQACREVMRSVGASDIEGLREAPVEQLVAARAGLMARMFSGFDGADGAPSGAWLPFGPVVDGHLLPAAPLDLIADASHPRVPLLVGTNAEEWKLFMLMDPATLDDAALEERARRVAGDAGPQIIEAYRDRLGGVSPNDLFGALAGDFIFHVPAARLADAWRSGPCAGSVHQYLFSYRSTSMGGLLGACHALEIPFVFDALGAPGIEMFVGPGAPGDLATAMQDAWLAFARSGDPGHDGIPPWPALGEATEAQVMGFDTEISLMVEPVAERIHLWDGLV